MRTRTFLLCTGRACAALAATARARRIRSCSCSRPRRSPTCSRQLGPLYAKETGQPVKFSFAASSALARQLEAGADADVFVSADVEWMDYVQTRGADRPRDSAATCSATGSC